MDKNDIIEYVMHTPHNTNRAVLNSMLNQLGGGGSGDGYLGIHTATINVTFDTSSISGDVTAIEYAYIDLNGGNGGNGSTIIQFAYGDSAIPVAELGTPTQMLIPTSDDYPAFIGESTFSWLNASSSALMVSEISVVSGDAEQTEYGVVVTGDCSLNIKVQYQG